VASGRTHGRSVFFSEAGIHHSHSHVQCRGDDDIVFQTRSSLPQLISLIQTLQGHAARNIYSTMRATTGIWALDIVLDTCVDDTLRIVYGAILKIIASRDSNTIHNNMCQQLCAASSSPNATACVSPDSSVLTRIRVISSKTTLLETRSENIAFSSTESTRFFLSVQVRLS
jgi:hypothetical protein